MASLKEVKTRIGSVKTTRKITSARGMVASTKLRRAQQALEKARAGRKALEALRDDLALPMPDAFSVASNPDAPVAVVAIASDSGMAGAFNSLVERELEHDRARAELRTIGTKIGADLPAAILLEQLRALCAELTGRFLRGEISAVELVYHDFQGMSSQPVVRETLLPLPATPQVDPDRDPADRWIIEPSKEALAGQIVRLLLMARFWTAIASSRTSEQIARMIAMQAATDNADELLDELQLTYNKLRQQNITSELLDIIGSSFA